MSVACAGAARAIPPSLAGGAKRPIRHHLVVDNQLSSDYHFKRPKMGAKHGLSEVGPFVGQP